MTNATTTMNDTPIGPVQLTVGPGGLSEIRFGAGPGASRGQRPPESAQRVLEQAKRQLAEYFAGRLHVFDLPLDLRGTPFRVAVWKALLEIPFGMTVSYAEIAQRVGKPSAVRAVGTANGANPVPIVVPCHRVVGSDGTLTGYGGGLPIKRWLLAHEGVGLIRDRVIPHSGDSQLELPTGR